MFPSIHSRPSSPACDAACDVVCQVDRYGGSRRLHNSSHPSASSDGGVVVVSTYKNTHTCPDQHHKHTCPLQLIMSITDLSVLPTSGKPNSFFAMAVLCNTYKSVTVNVCKYVRTMLRSIRVKVPLPLWYGLPYIYRWKKNLKEISMFSLVPHLLSSLFFFCHFLFLANDSHSFPFFLSSPSIYSPYIALRLALFVLTYRARSIPTRHVDLSPCCTPCCTRITHAAGTKRRGGRWKRRHWKKKGRNTLLFYTKDNVCSLIIQRFVHICSGRVTRPTFFWHAHNFHWWDSQTFWETRKACRV